VNHALGLGSGTDGNHLAMLGCDIGQGDEVLIPVNTFIATAEGISLAGANPVFVDIDEKTFNIDVSKIERVINQKTRAISPVHLYGHPCDLDPIIEIGKVHDLAVIEDSAQAHFAEYKGKKVGGLGSISSWSFYPGKNLGAWGEAGAVTTNNEEIFNKLKKYRNHGSNRKYYHDIIGHNYRMSELQAAVLIVKMKYIQKWTEMRQLNAQKYNERLIDIERVVTPFESKDSKHVYHLYVVRVEKRDKLQAYLDEKGISTGIHYPFPLHLTDAYRFLGYNKGDFPIAEKVSEEILSLPMYPELNELQIDYVCEMIRRFYI